MNKYDKLSERQKKVFDTYIDNRSVDATAKALDMNSGDTYRVINSDKFQLALKEYNVSLADRVNYDASSIIERLWGIYNDYDAPIKEKINILVLLGKHIGMWAPAAKEKDAKASIQYNIVNYNGFREEITVHEKEIELIKDETPEGFKILSFEDKENVYSD